MRKILLSVVTFFVVSVCQAAVGDDLTSKYLKNADFSQGDVVEKYICTYDYDMNSDEQLYGQQAVEGWDAANLSDNIRVSESSGNARTDGLNARAAALFAIGDREEATARLGGANYIAPDVLSNGATTGKVLGMVAVWGATVQYSQAVTLPAGAYTITVMTQNVGGTTAVSSNLFGFIAEDGTAYTCPVRQWEELEVWAPQQVTFYLEKETAGIISLGYAAGGAGSAAMPHLFIESVKIEQADAAPIIKAEIDALKESQLLPLLEAGDELGVDTKAGWVVYNNDAATKEEVEKAIENQKAINERGMTDFTEYFINNAHFAQGTPLDNGVCTYDYDMQNNGTTQFGMQPIQEWAANRPSDNILGASNRSENGCASGLFAVGSDETIWLGSKGDVVPATKANGAAEGNLFGFICVWSGTSYYYQNATLPAGSYTITIPTYNERGTGAIVKNLCGFVTEDGVEYLATTTVFPEKVWSNETIKFTLDEETAGQFRIGYQAANAGSGSMPHLFVDEFTLMYNGVLSNPSLLALSGAVRTAENYLNGDAKFEESIREKLVEAAEAGQALVSAGSDDDEANVAAATAINVVLGEASASVAEYAKFQDFLEGELADAVAKYEEGDMAKFGETLADLRDEYLDAYDAGSLNTQQINEAIAGLKPAIVSAVKETLAACATDGQEHNLDISVLYENISFENRNVGGWKASFTSGKFESQVSGVCEVWSNSTVDFTASTTLAELPAGVYEISAPAWFRDGGDMLDAFSRYENDELVGNAYIFANGNKAGLLNQGDERLQGAEADLWHNAAVLEDELYLPNGQTQAYFVFYNSDIDVTNSVTTALLEEGDLTIGFKGEGLLNGAWVVWGTMKVVYKGQNAELTLAALNGELNDLLSQAEVMLDDEFVTCVKASESQLNKAVATGEAALGSDETTTKVEAIAGLKDAIDYASKSEGLINRLYEIYEMYSDMLSDTDVESNDNTLVNLLDVEIGDPYDGAKSNEQIEEWIEAIPLAWIKYVCGQPEMAKATEQNPVDVTAAVLNADFEGVDGETPGASYWTVTRNGGNEGYQNGIYEFYNNASFDIRQTLLGVPDGCYRVRVQAFYRAGDNPTNLASVVKEEEKASEPALIDETEGEEEAEEVEEQPINKAYLYLNERAVALKNVLELEDVADSDYKAGEAFDVAGEVKVDYKGNAEFTIPNDRNSLGSYFEAGCYWNELDCMVAGGKLTLGLRKYASVVNDWCPYDNFQLFYLGTEVPSTVETISAATAAKSTIYDLQGRKVSKPQKGLYIVNGKAVIVK